MTKFQRLLLEDLQQRYTDIGRLWNFNQETTREQVSALYSPLHLIQFGRYKMLEDLIKDNA